MISIIIPFYNEQESLPVLLKELEEVMNRFDQKYEIIFVDDGSTDASASKLKIKNENLKIIKHKKQFGKGEALTTGIKNSSGNTIIFMDGDLQDDPRDIPKFIKKIDEGNDLVNGVRKVRKDNFLIKSYSNLFNWFLHNFLKSPVSDINCGFKAIRKEVFEEIILYGNNFRFLPLAAYYKGFKVSEIEVNNRERKYGKSKFGAGKFFIGILDTTSAYFLYQFSEKPLHFFGSIGSFFFLIGFIIAVILSIERLFFGQLLYRRPALLLAVVLIIVGIQILMTGIIGELIVYLNKKKWIQF